MHENPERAAKQVEQNEEGSPYSVAGFLFQIHGGAKITAMRMLSNLCTRFYCSAFRMNLQFLAKLMIAS